MSERPIEIDLFRASEELCNRGCVLILAHARPDGDTIGSAWALKCALEARQIQAEVVCDDPIPRRLQFIVDGRESLTHETLPEGFLPDYVVAVDVAEIKLLGEYGRSLEGSIDLKIDHHAGGSRFARLNYINGGSASCAEIIFDLVLNMGKKCMTDAVKRALYAGMASDTGCFRYSNVTASTHRKAADLIAGGVDFAQINTLLFESKSYGEIRAAMMTYKNLQLYRGGSVAMLFVTNELREKNNLTMDDLGDISSLPREIDGVELSVVVKQSEKHPERFRISMRSGSDYASNSLCAMFGGGGHMRAAGAMVEAATPEEAEELIRDKVLDRLEQVYGAYESLKRRI